MKKLALLIVLSVTLIAAALPALAQQPGCDPTVNYLKQGWAQLEAHNHDGALASFTCGLQLEPDNARLYYGLAEFYCHTGEVGKAIENFRKAVEIDPDYAMGWNTLGWAYYNYGDLDSALAAVNRSIEIDPANPYPYNNRGLVYARWGQLGQAQADFRQAIDLGLAQPWALTNLYNLTNYVR